MGGWMNWRIIRKGHETDSGKGVVIKSILYPLRLTSPFRQREGLKILLKDIVLSRFVSRDFRIFFRYSF